MTFWWKFFLSEMDISGFLHASFEVSEIVPELIHIDSFLSKHLIHLRNGFIIVILVLRIYIFPGNP